MTSPTRTPRPGLSRHARVWTRRLTATVTATTAGGVMLLGSPVLTGGAAASSPSGVDTADPAVRLVAAERHRWPGHPGRSLVRYRVKRGDTATGIAVRFHAWTRELRRVNHLGRHGTLYAGRVIRVPVVLSAVRRHHARHHTHRHHVRHHVRHHHAKHHAKKRHHHRTTKHHAKHHAKKRHHARHHKSWRHADASRATVRRVIIRTAHRHHVKPRTVLAISWQESGWQQRRRSSAGAIGAMQIMPGTGRWMSLYVGRKLNIYSLHDNVVAGVLLFKVLRAQTSKKRAIGGYYQGLGSIQQRGMYPSTRRYVRNVKAISRMLRRGWNPA